MPLPSGQMMILDGVLQDLLLTFGNYDPNVLGRPNDRNAAYEVVSYLPTIAASCTRLRSLCLYGNDQFGDDEQSSPFPPSISRLSALTSLIVDKAWLQPLPDSLFSMTNLRVLSLDCYFAEGNVLSMRLRSLSNLHTLQVCEMPFSSW